MPRYKLVNPEFTAEEEAKRNQEELIGKLVLLREQ